MEPDIPATTGPQGARPAEKAPVETARAETAPAESTPDETVDTAAAEADAAATRWLLAAAGSGALLGAAWQLAGAGELPFFPENFAGTLLASFGSGILAALLILSAWFLTARSEARNGIRQQRGAMAALTGLAVFCIPFTADLVYSPVFGAALLLLAVRTGEARTAAAGVMALAAALIPAVSADLPGMAVAGGLGLTAAATLAAAVQLRSRYSPR